LTHWTAINCCGSASLFNLFGSARMVTVQVHSFYYSQFSQEKWGTFNGSLVRGKQEWDLEPSRVKQRIKTSISSFEQLVLPILQQNQLHCLLGTQLFLHWLFISFLVFLPIALCLQFTEYARYSPTCWPDPCQINCKLQMQLIVHGYWTVLATAFRIILAVSTDCYRHIGSPRPFYATQEHANASAVDNWASNTLEITIHWYHQWKSVTFWFWIQYRICFSLQISNIGLTHNLSIIIHFW